MILLSLILGLSAFVFQLWLLPTFPLLVLAPVCTLVLQQKGRSAGLWTAALCGLIYDLILVDSPFGLYGLAYVITLGCVSLIRKPLFSQTLPLLTAAFSVVYWIIALILFHNPLSLSEVVIHLTLCPLADLLYAFFWFTCPLLLYTRINGTARHHLRSHTRG